VGIGAARTFTSAREESLANAGGAHRGTRCRASRLRTDGLVDCLLERVGVGALHPPAVHEEVGVPLTPTAAASAWSAFTASSDFRPCMQSFSFGTSRPAAVAISSTLAGRFSLLISFCLAKRPL
jgi:hypothetical protein